MKKTTSILLVLLMFLMFSWKTYQTPKMVYDDFFEVSNLRPTVLDVFANDTFPVGSTAKIISVTQPKNGIVIINPDSTSVTYIPFRRVPGRKKISGNSKVVDKKIFISN